MAIKRIQGSKRFSQAVVHGNMVYTTGQIALDSAGESIIIQTKEVLDRIDSLLSEAGTDISKLIFATIWLADFKDYDEMNEVWDDWLAPGNAPARACVGSKLVQPHFKVEISVIAAI